MDFLVLVGFFFFFEGWGLFCFVLFFYVFMFGWFCVVGCFVFVNCWPYTKPF